MQTIKEEAIRIISNLPDDVSMDDIMYKLYVMDKIKSGQSDIKSGNYLSSDDVRKEIEKW
ncbi:hypothetical protein [Maledivibacter halophilus]|uniref:Uncharacterized protein n=1 Tax=Maledivibacter halophilus TaxID=36842 RepID=A0A1T5M120_9FIRM|nr:hypothetical protein [Maledivibacter halophilus]SKC81950.1 hypothetical protein SAMN02194393_03683 [Maledivibacter halophilus]